MKKMRIIFSVAIVLSALGAGFTEPVAIQSAFVHVRFVGQLNFVCVNAGLACDEVSTYLCRVYVPDLLRTTQAYRPVCVTSRYHSSPILTGMYTGPLVISDAD